MRTRQLSRPPRTVAWRTWSAIGLGSGIVAGLVSCGGSDDTTQPSTIALAVISSTSPDWVSGGDAAVAVTGNFNANSSLSVKLNGADVSSSFVADPAGGRRVGVVRGLNNGKNTLTAQVDYSYGFASANTSLEITNYPRNGPMFSGPRETPFICETANFNVLPDGSKLGAPLDADCSAAMRVDYVYRTTATTGAQFKSLTSLTAPLPADVANTTTTENKIVPYVVRIETGTVNRAIYQTAVIDTRG